jgi:hypothetical protein
MSTRCVVNFCFTSAKPIVIAKVYRHYDGDSMGSDLELFFSEVREQAKLEDESPRFHDPSYLAAKFVVWQAAHYTRNKRSPLVFSGVGVVVEDPGDLRYEWFVECEPEGTVTPKVTTRP